MTADTLRDLAAYPVAERAFHVVRSFKGDGEEYELRIKDRATLTSFPVEKDHLKAHRLADALNAAVARHVGRALAALDEGR